MRRPEYNLRMENAAHTERKLLTLCFIHEHPRILLGMKKRGFGAGRWNGFGGKVAPGESIEEAAVRELREETGIEAEPDDLEDAGILEFEFKDSAATGGATLEVHLFRLSAGAYVGEPQETEEMRPQWFFVDEIPFRQMWSDDPFWMPLFLKGRRFRARFVFDKPSTAETNARILEKEIHLL